MLPLPLVIMRLAKDCFYNVKVRSTGMYWYNFIFTAMYIHIITHYAFIICMYMTNIHSTKIRMIC